MSLPTRKGRAEGEGENCQALAWLAHSRLSTDTHQQHTGQSITAPRSATQRRHLPVPRGEGQRRKQPLPTGCTPLQPCNQRRASHLPEGVGTLEPAPHDPVHRPGLDTSTEGHCTRAPTFPGAALPAQVGPPQPCSPCPDTCWGAPGHARSAGAPAGGVQRSAASVLRSENRRRRKRGQGRQSCPGHALPSGAPEPDDRGPGGPKKLSDAGSLSGAQSRGQETQTRSQRGRSWEAKGSEEAGARSPPGQPTAQRCRLDPGTRSPSVSPGRWTVTSGTWTRAGSVRRDKAK